MNLSQMSNIILLINKVTPTSCWRLRVRDTRREERGERREERRGEERRREMRRPSSSCIPSSSPLLFSSSPLLLFSSSPLLLLSFMFCSIKSRVSVTLFTVWGLGGSCGRRAPLPVGGGGQLYLEKQKKRNVVTWQSSPRLQWHWKETMETLSLWSFLASFPPFLLASFPQPLSPLPVPRGFRDPVQGLRDPVPPPSRQGAPNK